MAKIVRYNGNLQAFASAAIGTERTLFGEVAQANDLTSQVTADFLRGWGIVGPSDQPALEDFNAAMYTHGQILAYLHQAGVPEYNALQEYFSGGVTQVDSAIYISLTDANIGNSPSSSPASWKPLTSGQFIGTQTITASGTYTPNAKMKFVRVRALGGGGGVAGMLFTPANAAAFSSGGAAGGYSEGIFTKAQIGASISATIGLGGAAGTSTTSGGNGGTTTLGSLMTVPGGGGAPVSTAFATSFAYMFSGGAPGALPTGGSIANAKGAGGGFSISTGTGVTLGGPGASSQLGAGGYPLGSYVASPGSGYGAGAGGALKPPGVAATDGVAGQPGVIIIEEYA